MRDTEPPPPPWRPLGERVPREAPAPPPKPREVAPGIIKGEDGRLSTNLPLPKG